MKKLIGVLALGIVLTGCFGCREDHDGDLAHVAQQLAQMRVAFAFGEFASYNLKQQEEFIINYERYLRKFVELGDHAVKNHEKYNTYAFKDVLELNRKDLEGMLEAKK